MPVEVIFPKVDMDMESGELTEWLCKSGDTVREGEPLFVIETDKSGMEVEALSSGTLQIVHDLSGQQVPVGKVLAHIYKDGEDIAEAQAPFTDALPATDTQPGTDTLIEYSLAVLNKSSSASDADLAISGFANNHVAGSRASPAARKLARKNAIALSQIVGSSYRGRIVKSDVAAYLAIQFSDRSDAVAVDANGSTTELDCSVKDQVLPHSNMRKTIASRLTMACQTIPSYQVSIECNCESLLRLKSELARLPDKGNGTTVQPATATTAISVNDFFVKALAMSLRDHPMANSVWTDDARIVHGSVDIGIAVALADGLITPIVKNAGNKSIRQISFEIKELVARAKQGTLTRSQYQGGTSTVSNLGMYGVAQFNSIINPPQASILSIGAVQKSPVVIDDTLAIASLCRATFTFDHRLIDGAAGAKLAASFKVYVENAVAMVI